MSTPLDVDRLRAYAVPPHRERYDPRDAILYALGVGAGLAESVDERDLLFERRLKVLPTLALVLGTPGFWPMDPRAGLDWPRILHGAQTLRLHRPLAMDGELAGVTLIGDIADKGPGKAALVRARRTLTSPGGALIAEMDETWVVREAGGFGGARALPGDAPSPLPDAAPDCALDLPTAPNQAMLYRLSGDRNPLHIDPAAAARGGFERPILHGLATMGLAARALSQLCCGGDPARLSSMRARFAAPVFPGETIRTEAWRVGDAVRYRATVPARGIVAIDRGEATIDAFGRTDR